MKDYYKILGVGIDATNKEISAAYRTLAKLNHPDRGGLAENMILINLAYEILGNETQRKEYDEQYIYAKNETILAKEKSRETSFNDRDNYSSHSHYWNNSNFEQSYKTPYTDTVWNSFVNKFDEKVTLDSLIEKNIKITSNNFGKQLKNIFVVTEEEYILCINEIFPKFIRAGYTLSNVLKEVTPDHQEYWDKYYNVFLSVFGDSIYEYLSEQNYRNVEKVFQDDFNILSKRFFESQVSNYQNTSLRENFYNSNFIIILASLFIYGYQTESANFYMNKSINENSPYSFFYKAGSFYGENRVKINFTVILTLLMITIISLYVYYSTF